MMDKMKSNRMKKGIFIGIAIYLGVLFLLKSILPERDFIQMEITDEKLTAELKAAAIVELKEYFDIELDESKQWETRIVHNVPNEGRELAPVYTVMQEDPSEDLIEGEISSYGVAMREDTREAVSMFYTQVSSAEIKDLSDEEIKKVTLDFLKEKGISKDDELQVTNIERSKDSQIVNIMIESQEVKYSVAYDLRLGKITYFEKIERYNSSQQ